MPTAWRTSAGENTPAAYAAAVRRVPSPQTTSGTTPAGAVDRGHHTGRRELEIRVEAGADVVRPLGEHQEAGKRFVRYGRHVRPVLAGRAPRERRAFQLKHDSHFLDEPET
ncbi:hypothetical protein [Streptomyces sp. NPDC046942]|uniref:hypothetical protein n=1 Tax=Streptomyces sp. NPDC046942 TaxID=3155137 RepID=UPI00340D949D